MGLRGSITEICALSNLAAQLRRGGSFDESEVLFERAMALIEQRPVENANIRSFAIASYGGLLYDLTTL